MIYSNVWGFEFNSKEMDLYSNSQVEIGRYVKLGYNTLNNLLEDYHGIKLEFKSKDDIKVEKAIDLIKFEINNGQPVMIEVDTFWLPWSKRGFQNVFNLHEERYCLVIGYNENENILCCLEQENGNNKMYLTIEYFRLAFISLYTFEFNEEVQEIEWKTVLKMAYSNLYNKCNERNAFSDMHDFARTILAHHDIVFAELKKFTILHSKLILAIYNLSHCRKKFALVLKYLLDKTNESQILHICNCIEKASIEWDIIRGLILKASLMSESVDILKRASIKIDELANFEEKIANKMYDLYSNFL